MLIGFEESAQVLTTLFESGFTADQESTIYLVDGNVGNALGEQLPAGSLVGVKGTLPQAELTEDFRARLLEVDPALIDFSYGPETYDAMIIVALAAEMAGSDDPAAIAATSTASRATAPSARRSRSARPSSPTARTSTTTVLLAR